MDPRSLSELLEGIPAQTGDALATMVTGIAYRSDRVRAGDVFFCVSGFAHDGHDFAADAVSRGASALVTSRALDAVGVPQAVVADTRAALAVVSARYYGLPSERLDVVGITGTNGKTTTTYLVEAIARRAGRSPGLIGTVQTRYDGSCESSGRTTPESLDLQALLARMVDAGVDTVAMEVSSHAIDLHRVDGVRFAVAAFANLSQDHLDYHHTLEEYFNTKVRLFTDMHPRLRVINVDDWHGRRLAGMVGADWTVGCAPEATVRGVDVRLTSVSASFRLVTPAGEADVVLPLAGEFNVANALLAAGCGLALGIAPGTIAEGLTGVQQIPGRLEHIDEGQSFSVLVDYAHSPDGLEKAIAAVRQVTEGRVITVFGCGGDRDPSKRAPMGEAAGRLSDAVVITSDNPRSEEPGAVIAQVETGVDRTAAAKRVEPDRRSAIALALSEAGPGDAVLIAGKGHEDYQIFADRTVHFDDREVAHEELRRLGWGSDAAC